MDNKSRNDELIERLIRFGEHLIELCYKIPQNPINSPLISQLIRCGTSVGANYSEACGAESSKDSVHKIKLVLKESKETRYFLRLILKSNPTFKNEIIILGKEVVEYIKIFSSILSRFKN